MSESETILLRRFAATGDPEAFSEIVRRHAGLVYGACLRVLADKDRTKTAKSVDQLMGTKPEARFAFISERAEFAKDELLDV